MNSLRLVLAAVALAACAPSEPGAAPDDTESTESNLSATGRGVVATNASDYALASPNVARELVESGVGDIPGVLGASSSTSPYAYAATLELSAWSSVSTTTFDGGVAAPGRLYVRVDGAPGSRTGKVAKKIFDAMTNVAAAPENGALVKRSSKGSVICASYPDYVQCFLGPVDHVASR